MYCPQCGAEYREGFTRCSDCDVELVPQGPPEGDLEPVELVTILETATPSVLMVAKSVLEGAGIPFFPVGEGVQDLFAVGPVHLQVERERADEARALLAEITEEPPEEE